jgi:hypothetical protein
LLDGLLNVEAKDSAFVGKLKGSHGLLVISTAFPIGFLNIKVVGVF